MKLITKAIEAKLPGLYSTEKTPTEDKVAIVKFFGPGRVTWYATEASREDGDLRFFGYVVSPLGADCDEWGYFSLAELESIKIPINLNGRVVGHAKIERDLHFRPTRMGELFPDVFRKSAVDPEAAAEDLVIGQIEKTEALAAEEAEALAAEEAYIEMRDPSVRPTVIKVSQTHWIVTL